jgi:hypothetical protein
MSAEVARRSQCIQQTQQRNSIKLAATKGANADLFLRNEEARSSASAWSSGARVMTKRVEHFNTKSCSSSPPDLKQLTNELLKLSFQFSSSSQQLCADMMSRSFPNALHRFEARFSDNCSAHMLMAAITSSLEEK